MIVTAATSGGWCQPMHYYLKNTARYVSNNLLASDEASRFVTQPQPPTIPGLALLIEDVGSEARTASARVRVVLSQVSGRISVFQNSDY